MSKTNRTYDDAIAGWLQSDEENRQKADQYLSENSDAFHHLLNASCLRLGLGNEQLGEWLGNTTEGNKYSRETVRQWRNGVTLPDEEVLPAFLSFARQWENGCREAYEPLDQGGNYQPWFNRQRIEQLEHAYVIASDHKREESAEKHIGKNGTEFRHLFQAWRRYMGMSKEQLGEELGRIMGRKAYSKSTISKWEGRVMMPDKETLDAFLNFAAQHEEERKQQYQSIGKEETYEPWFTYERADELVEAYNQAINQQPKARHDNRGVTLENLEVGAFTEKKLPEQEAYK